MVGNTMLSDMGEMVFSMAMATGYGKSVYHEDCIDTASFTAIVLQSIHTFQSHSNSFSPACLFHSIHEYRCFLSAEARITPLQATI